MVLLIGGASCLIDGVGWGIFQFDFFSSPFIGLAVAQGGKEINALYSPFLVDDSHTV